MSQFVPATLLVLKDGSETAQGKTHVIHNINACQAISEIVRTTLGPRGMDKLIYTQNGKVTISNDGRTIIDLLDIVHPAAKTMVDIAVAQDNQVGDGTTSVVVISAELLKQAKLFIEDGVHPQTIIRAYRKSQKAVLDRLEQLSVDYKKNDKYKFRDVLERCAKTALNSKLISNHRDFFSQIAVDAVLSLDQNELNLDLVGIQKVAGGSVTASELVRGVAFKKTFSYAGFEQQPKHFENALVLILNIELELKAEKENAEIRLKDLTEYQACVDAEWKLIYEKLDAIVKSGAKVVLSRLAIGDLATQYFADNNIFCAGRVPESDMERVAAATGAVQQTTLGDLNEHILGKCGVFEERQVGNERYNFFTHCENAKTATVILRGGAEQFIEETHRSLWDALMVVKRCIQHHEVVGGGGAIEMELSRYLRDVSKQIKDKTQLIMSAYAKALEVIPRQLANNAGFDSTDIVNQLRFQHAKGERWYGVDIENGGVCDTLEKFVWEPSLNKRSCLAAATEAACTILSIDETIKNAKAQDAASQEANRPVPSPNRRQGMDRPPIN